MPSDAPKIFVAGPTQRRGVFRALLILLLLLVTGALVACYFFSKPALVATGPNSEANILSAQAVLPPEPPVIPLPEIIAPQVLPHDPPETTLLPGLEANLELFLPFSGNLEDASPHKHKLQSFGDVAATAQGAHFLGDGFLTAPHIAFDGHPFSFALWVLPLGRIDGYGLLQQVSEPSRNMHLHIMFREPNLPRIGFYLNDLQAPQPIQTGVWTHLVFQFTGKRQEIWLNGNRIAKQDSAAYLGTSGATLIGHAPQWNNVPSSTFQGFMRDLRIYNVALDAEQIRVLSAAHGFKAAVPGSGIQKTVPPVRDEQF